MIKGLNDMFRRSRCFTVFCLNGYGVAPHTACLPERTIARQDITLWEFKDALNRLETAKLHYKTPDIVNKAASAVGKPNVMQQGAEKFHTPQKVKDDKV